MENVFKNVIQFFIDSLILFQSADSSHFDDQCFLCSWETRCHRQIQHRGESMTSFQIWAHFYEFLKCECLNQFYNKIFWRKFSNDSHFHLLRLFIGSHEGYQVTFHPSLKTKNEITPRKFRRKILEFSSFFLFKFDPTEVKNPFVNL